MKAEAYTTPVALQSLLNSFGYSIASDLAGRSLLTLKQAADVLHSHSQGKVELLRTLQVQLQVRIRRTVLHQSRHSILIVANRSFCSCTKKLARTPCLPFSKGPKYFRSSKAGSLQASCLLLLSGSTEETVCRADISRDQNNLLHSTQLL